MAKYGRLFIYRRNTLVEQTTLIAKDVTLEYDIEALLGKNLTILYDIVSVDARTLWAPKDIGQVFWEAPEPSNPTGRLVSIEEHEEVDGVLLYEDGGAFLLEDGSYLLLE